MVLSKVLIYRVLPSGKRPRITQIPCMSHLYTCITKLLYSCVSVNKCKYKSKRFRIIVITATLNYSA